MVPRSRQGCVLLAFAVEAVSALLLASAALAQQVPRLPAAKLARQSATIGYASAGSPQFVCQVEGLGVASGQGIELALQSTRPTQLRLYLIAESGEGRYRYVVLSGGPATVGLSLPVEAFDPDPQVQRGRVPPGGALLIVDVPGFMRGPMENELTVGPFRVTTHPAPLPAEQTPPVTLPSGDRLFDRLLGGWLGKIAGGRHGMPREGKLAPDWSAVERARDGLSPVLFGFGPDDDTSYMVLHLGLFSEKGAALSPGDIARAWRERFCAEYRWKNERRALELLARGTPPLECGRGPLQDSICARIRADLWGMLASGRPEMALELAGRDAPISNAGDGVAAAEFAAVAASLAPESGSPLTLLQKTLRVVGARGGAHSALIRRCLELHAAGKTVQQAREAVRREAFEPARARDAANAWAYAMPNSGALALALLYGEGDFARTMGLAAAIGWDTDCNAATAGCLLGLMHGASRIPAVWTEPLGDRLRVAIAGQEHWSIRRLAWLTWRMARGGS